MTNRQDLHNHRWRSGRTTENLEGGIRSEDENCDAEKRLTTSAKCSRELRFMVVAVAYCFICFSRAGKVFARSLCSKTAECPRPSTSSVILSESSLVPEAARGPSRPRAPAK